MLKTLGLGGDGDEVDAIEGVEREFGVTLDKSDAANWLTVGDVYLSLQHALPSEVANLRSTWARYYEVLGRSVGVYSKLIDIKTRIKCLVLLWSRH